MAELKRVSFAVAKAIREAGYPQDDLSFWYDANGVVFAIRPKEGTEYYVAPEYLKIWLWLCNHNIPINVTYDLIRKRYVAKFNANDYFVGKDPEEAIKSAIEYLVTNKLLK